MFVHISSVIASAKSTIAPVLLHLDSIVMAAGLAEQQFVEQPAHAAIFLYNLKEFVQLLSHPAPQRVWQGGPVLKLMTPFPGHPAPVPNHNVFSIENYCFARQK